MSEISFSNLEGIGIPPIEAALAGNKVIGYTGGGGIEYWGLPLFKKIEPGEIDDFGQILLKEIKNYKPNWIKESKKYRKQLSKQYSEKNQTKSLIKLIKIIGFDKDDYYLNYKTFAKNEIEALENFMVRIS